MEDRIKKLEELKRIAKEMKRMEDPQYKKDKIASFKLNAEELMGYMQHHMAIDRPDMLLASVVLLDKIITDCGFPIIIEAIVRLAIGKILLEKENL